MKKALVMCAALLVVFAAMATAQPETDRHPMERHGHKSLLEGLNLTDQQQVEMKTLRLAMEKKSIQSNAKIRLARVELRELFAAEKPDRGAIEKRMKDVSDLQYQEKLDWVDHHFAVIALLTPEQQKIWKKHMGSFGRGEMMRHRGIRKHMGMGGPGMGMLPPQGDEEVTETIDQN